MKAVLISIQPKWCELIASGKKTVEVRKTRPKIEAPFKCYIYMTKGFASYPVQINGYPYICNNNGGMEVIGEFVCDRIYEMPFSPYNHGVHLFEDDLTNEMMCLTQIELNDYLADRNGYGWHISDLVIYEKPKELGEFYTLKKCDSCKSGYESTACIYDEDCRVPSPLKRPFQSWGYVEERSEK